MATLTPPTSSHNTITSSASTSSALQSDISPSSLDTLPILSAILTRLQSSSLAGGLNHAGSPLPSQSQTQAQTLASTSSPSFPATSSTTKDLFSTAPLTTKEIPAASDGLKYRLQKTRAQVAQLPDMDRNIAEQEEEIRQLQANIAEQRQVLEALKAMGSNEKMQE